MPTLRSSLFYVDTLEYLRRGGRIGAASALFGGALAVKPLLTITDGRVSTLEKVRTAGRALGRLEDLAVEAAGDRQVDVCVSHLASAERAEPWRDDLADPTGRQPRRPGDLVRRARVRCSAPMWVRAWSRCAWRRLPRLSPRTLTGRPLLAVVHRPGRGSSPHGLPDA